MYKSVLFLLYVVVCSFSPKICTGQSQQTTLEYFNWNKSLQFNGFAYKLKWSSHPSEDYFKQEYLQDGDSLPAYKQMIMADLLVGKIKLENVVAKKVDALREMQKTNPIVQFETFEKDDEIMLDFLVSQQTPDGKLVSIVEHNLYRYKPVKLADGKKGILMIGVSTRAYGNDVMPFFSTLKKNKSSLLVKLGNWEIPVIALGK